MYTFPKGFLWGTATSSHQVEGNNRNNQWAWWEQQPGRIWQGQVAGRACDWWEHAERDFDLMVQLHQNAHRLSIEWSRVEPEAGQFDEKAIARYRAMIEGLRERGIEPMVTLYHFTEPLWFWRRGSWLHPDALPAFRRYVMRVAEALGDSVRLWCTVNEPVVYAALGYLAGRFPPGEHNPVRGFRVLRQLVLAHAAAYHAVHEVIPEAQVGLAKSLFVFAPWRPHHPLDRLLTRLVTYLYNTLVLDAIHDGIFRPPLGLGRTPYPALAGTADFIGVNYYGRNMVTFDVHRPQTLFIREFSHPHGETTDITARGEPYSEVYPEGLYELLRWLWRRYGKPLYVTENGLPDEDDDQRPAFIVRHLLQVHRAIQEGVDVRGYFHWTLVDNFEWADGWKLRFGLVALDPETQERRPRPSAGVYATICRENGIPDDLVARYAKP